MWSRSIISLLTFAVVIVSVFGEDTAKEKAAIEKLRKSVGKLEPDYLNEDFMLLNFLRDSNFNIQEATTKMKASVEWRKKNNIAGIRDEPILPELFPFRVQGHDKAGNPIMYVSPSRWDIRKLMIAGQREQLIRYYAKLVETGMHAVLADRNSTGKDIRTINTVMDLHGYNLRQHACLTCFPLYFDWVRNYERNYPQLLIRFYMINTPRVFQPLLELLKGVFSPHTSKILQVFGPNKEEWRKELLKVIDDTELAKFYGGTNEK